VAGIYLNALQTVERDEGREHILRSLDTFVQVREREKEKERERERDRFTHFGIIFREY
jgi:hypothetical protein